ncbi:MAG: lactate utilization protein [Spirochaetaceae bacterium]|jgi:L-lactate utilization protein LutB|nr:lactate utilization protein [Spirochaetaceae bacterium]
MKTPREIRYDKLGPKVVTALRSRGFEAWYFESPEAGTEQFFSLIPKTDVVSWGGTMTAQELRLMDMLYEKGYQVIDRDKASSPEERTERMRQALLCDTFVAGTNALSEDGQLVNIDGIGNRTAAMIFGPKQVIIVAGMNKVVRTLDDAMVRARTVAAPINMQRFSGKTPCGETGACGNCLSADSICTFIVTTRRCKPAGRIKIILIGKDLGF